MKRRPFLSAPLIGVGFPFATPGGYIQMMVEILGHLPDESIHTIFDVLADFVMDRDGAAHEELNGNGHVNGREHQEHANDLFIRL